jgi:hypothetical protein
VFDEFSQHPQPGLLKENSKGTKMNLPGFTADSSLHRSTANYRSIWHRRGTYRSQVEAAQVLTALQMRPLWGIGNDGCRCPPRETPCSFDPTSRTGCSSFWVDCDCGHGKVLCTGCARPDCPPGLVKCNGVCIDLSNNPIHCGSCNNACPFGQFCCEGGCTDIKSDPNNCGGCGNVCTSPTSTCCFGTCFDITRGPFCGTCGFVCPIGAFCCEGKGCCPTGTVCRDFFGLPFCSPF